LAVGEGALGPKGAGPVGLEVSANLGLVLLVVDLAVVLVTLVEPRVVALVSTPTAPSVVRIRVRVTDLAVVFQGRSEGSIHGGSTIAHHLVVGVEGVNLAHHHAGILLHHELGGIHELAWLHLLLARVDERSLS